MSHGAEAHTCGGRCRALVRHSLAAVMSLSSVSHEAGIRHPFSFRSKHWYKRRAMVIYLSHSGDSSTSWDCLHTHTSVLNLPCHQKSDKSASKMSLGALHTRHLQESPACLRGVADCEIIKATKDFMQNSLRQISSGHARHPCFPAVPSAIKPCAFQGSIYTPCIHPCQ